MNALRIRIIALAIVCLLGTLATLAGCGGNASNDSGGGRSTQWSAGSGADLKLTIHTAGAPGSPARRPQAPAAAAQLRAHVRAADGTDVAPPQTVPVPAPGSTVTVDFGFVASTATTIVVEVLDASGNVLTTQAAGFTFQATVAVVNVDITVTTTPPPPSIVLAVTGLTPSRGPTAGGTAVIVSGTGFTGATAVKFGTTASGSYTVLSDTQIQASAPAHARGQVDVTVLTPTGTSATSAADLFTYAFPLTLAPPGGPDAGGNTVVITADSGLSTATAVSFGPNPAVSFTVDSDTQITATAPAGSGTVDVVVSTPSAPGVASYFYIPAGPAWSERSTDRNFYGVAYGAGVFVMVGKNKIVTSYDGVAWRQQNLNTTLTAVVFDGTQFVAVGYNGTVMTSANGIDWTQVTQSATTNTLQGIAYGDGTYVAVGLNGTVIKSTNRVDWTSQTSGTQTDLAGVAFGTIGLGQHAFVAVGGGYDNEDNPANGVILVSTNSGAAWSDHTPSPGFPFALFGVAIANGKIVAAGQQPAPPASVVLTGDGVSAFATADANLGQCSLYGVAFNPVYSRFVILGDNGNMATSSDGVTWTPVAWPAPTSAPPTANTLMAATFNAGGTSVVVGSGGCILSTPFDPENGLAALVRRSFESDDIYGMAACTDLGLFVAVGTEGAIGTSPNGTDWTLRRGRSDLQQLNAVAFGGGKFVAVGRGGQAELSSDGVTWTDSTLGGSHQMRGIAYGGGAFIAVGDTGEVHTYDGIAWTSSTAGSTNLSAIAYGDGTWVTVGNSGTILYSTNQGGTWTAATPTGTTANLWGVAYSPSAHRFVAVGDNGTVLCSGAGQIWTAGYSFTSGSLWSVTYASSIGGFVAVGDGGSIRFSPDGIDGLLWQVFPSASLPLRCVADKNRITVAGGASGEITIWDQD